LLKDPAKIFEDPTGSLTIIANQDLSSNISGYANTEKRVENMMHSAVSLTKLKVFG